MTENQLQEAIFEAVGLTYNVKPSENRVCPTRSLRFEVMVTEIFLPEVVNVVSVGVIPTFRTRPDVDLNSSVMETRVTTAG